MMRYQKVSPDCLPLNNGKKVTMKTCKEDGEATENGRVVPQNVYVNNGSSSSSSFETKSFRFRSPSRTQDNNNHNLSQFSSVSYSHQSDTNLNNHEPSSKQVQTQNQVQTQRLETSPSASSSPNRGGDMLLQWGHKKRSRVSRTEIRAQTEEPLSSSARVRQALKLKRRPVTCPNSDKLPTNSMPPPPPPLLALPSAAATSSSSSGRSRKVETSGFLPTRSLDDRCGGGSGNGSPSRISGGNNRVVCRSTAGKRSAHTEKSERKVLSSSGKSIKDEKPNGSYGQLGDHVNQVDSRTNKTGATSEKVTDNNNNNNNNNNTEVNEWPRIYIALSRKEKEDDFLAMKGTKLPQRPKKRAKNIERTLQYCFPGMWLSDLTRNRYEVREKKCVKKQKWRGLKGMESLDSDSE